MRPFIGITASLEDPLIVNDQNYSNAVFKAGGMPVIIPPLYDIDSVEAYLDGLDGLILSGGQDISPLRYDQDPHPKCGVFSDRRDEFEIALYLAARERDIPMLAICRGMQLINIVHGGSLVQDIIAQRPESLEHVKPDISPSTHFITTAENSIMRDILGEKAIINSLHHQAIAEIGTGLVPTAWAADGMIEALELDSLLALQFHPERLHQQSQFLAFFEDLVRRSQ